MILNRRSVARLPRAHRKPPQTGKILRGLAGTLIPQASRTSALILGHDTDLLI
jgi:hypothetical protein